MQTTRKTALFLKAPGLAGLLLLGLIAAPAAHAQGYTLNTLVNFTGTNGRNPVADLTLIGDTLYGTTSGGPSGPGTVFSVPVSGGTPATLVTFNGTDGQFPEAGLTLSADGRTFYGTTQQGGTNNDGTVFSIPVSGGTLTTLTSFNGTNGQAPNTGLTLIGSTLYGITRQGGANNDGTVFSVPVAGGTPSTLFSFSGSIGSGPVAGLTLSADRSTLYGTTEGDTNNNGTVFNGTVFSIPISGGTPTTLATFDGSNGKLPLAGLTLIGSTLYGTTFEGGANGIGTVFSVPASGGTPTTLASFSGSNGQLPEAGLTLSADGSTFYGTTYQGGANGGGTVFSVPVGGGTLTDLVSFSGGIDNGPVAGLTLGTNGTLYGTTFAGGAGGDGTVFSLTPNAPVPEASTTISFGLLLALGLGGVVIAARKKKAGAAGWRVTALAHPD